MQSIHKSLAKITAVASAVPADVMTNFDLEKIIDTNDKWIVERTGIHQRHIAKQGETTSTIVAAACKEILASTNTNPLDIDLIIVATITPDMMLPATACLVQDLIGAKNAWGFDLSIACSGFLYALQVAAQFVHNGTHKNVLVAGCDVMSSIIDYTDRQTCIIFGDGGGAALIQPSVLENDGVFLDFVHEIDGSGGKYLCIPAGGSLRPTTNETLANRMHYVHQDGATVFKFATRKMTEVCNKILERNNLTANDIDVFIPHQANKRIIDYVTDKMNFNPDKVIVNIGEYGNTTAGTLPLALKTAIDTNRLARGDLLLLATMGAGFTAGACLIKW